jgi:hypothetical protein
MASAPIPSTNVSLSCRRHFWRRLPSPGSGNHGIGSAGALYATAAGDRRDRRAACGNFVGRLRCSSKCCRWMTEDDDVETIEGAQDRPFAETNPGTDKRVSAPPARREKGLATMKWPTMFAIASLLLGIAGCVGEGIQAFDLVREDGAKADCRETVPVAWFVKDQIDPAVARCVVACKRLGFIVENTIPPGLINKKIDMTGDIPATECLILKK